MFKQWLGMHGSDLPLYAMILFVSIGALVTLYIVTDRRDAHRRRMEHLPLLEDGDEGRRHE